MPRRKPEYTPDKHMRSYVNGLMTGLQFAESDGTKKLESFIELWKEILDEYPDLIETNTKRCVCLDEGVPPNPIVWTDSVTGIRYFEKHGSHKPCLECAREKRILQEKQHAQGWQDAEKSKEQK
jgi:hypothetical protein